ncbi:MAG: TIGR03087 family PEP-CTERM/XrtA system glycosyltransferase [Blastomonas sp.]
MSGDILFLCHRIPFPPDRGDKIRSCHLLKALAEDHRVHVATFAENAEDRAAENTLADIATSHCLVDRNLSNGRAGALALLSGKPVSLAAFDSHAIRDYVAQVLRSHSIDTIVVFSGQMAQYVPEDFSGRFIMDFADVDSAKFESYAETAKGPMRAVYRREARMMASYERAIAVRADISSFVSEAEAALFRQRIGTAPARIEALGNGIDTEYYDPDLLDIAERPFVSHGPHIVFTGQMDYPPNIEAVSSFAREVMPAIHGQLPDAQFHIVGRAPGDAVMALAALPGVHVTGAVADVRPWIGYADLVVAPLRTARGIQNKVLEAMAMGRTVIASAQAAEGIDARHDREFLVAASPADEAAKAIALLSDRARARDIGAAARMRMLTHYGWNAQLAPLKAWLREPRATMGKAA